MNRKRAFTLIELIVVIAIIAIISAILFPVFTQAKSQTFQVTWIDSARQVALSTRLYLDDYDDTMMLPRHNLSSDANASNDRTWVQSLLPYARNFEVFFCPVDKTRPQSTAIFDPDLTVGNPTARYYDQSQRTNLGFNFTYLSPIFKQRGEWKMEPRMGGQIEDQSSTLLYADSAWKVERGYASGGGNYLVIPPCRFEKVNAAIIDTFGLANTANWQIFGNGLEWEEKGELWQGKAGGLYPWFRKNITVTFVDGHVKSIPLSEVAKGCDVQPGWQGYISNTQNYIWDLR
jgi:prepilin-type N-terminal cleavage/methylation domain-containing protein/prepilin-type processing-associated H-X9-DG protein